MSKKDLYMAELIFNLGRFVEQPLGLGPEERLSQIPETCYISQHIKGDYTAMTGVYGSDDVLKSFAEKYSKMDLSSEPGLTGELIADFLNLHNGLFIVNLSESENIESTLTVPSFDPNAAPGDIFGELYSVSVEFPFGTLCFLLSESL